MLENCMKLITEQQGSDQSNNLYWVGEHLKDICRTTPGAAELVACDIVQENMGLEFAEKKIKEYADSNRKGNQACVPPPVADRILREFYGITVDDNKEKPKAAVKTINILEFI